MEENIHTGHRDRLRQKALKNGLDSFEEHEVLELLLSFVIPYKDTNPLAHALIRKFGSFTSVLNANVHDLCRMEGIGVKTATFLSTLKDTYSYYQRSKINNVKLIRNSAEAYAYLKNHFAGKTNEEMFIVCLDASNKILHYEKVSEGNSKQTAVDIHKLTEISIRHSSHNIIIAHNHPDGVCKPSASDNKLTRAIAIGMAINSISLLDHIIITDNSMFSYNSEGLIDEYLKDVKDILQSSACQDYCTYNKPIDSNETK